jgi:hypothetical protein
LWLFHTAANQAGGKKYFFARKVDICHKLGHCGVGHKKHA